MVYTAEGRDPETGAAVKDRGSESFSCLIDSAAAPSGGREASDFAARLDREARRRGLHDAGGPVVVSDGADWIPNACEELFGGRKVTFVLDLLHCLERASDAVKAILPAGAERDRRFAEVKADVRAGRAAKVVRELAPFRDRHGEVEACCRYFERNLGRMRYGEFRERGLQVGSGVVEGGCRQFGPPLKRSGTRRAERGANAMPAPGGRVLNLGPPDPPGWRTRLSRHDQKLGYRAPGKLAQGQSVKVRRKGKANHHFHREPCARAREGACEASAAARVAGRTERRKGL